MQSAARHRLVAECGAECVSASSLIELEAGLSMQIKNVVVLFARCCLYLNEICCYQPCCAYRRAFF